MRKGLGSNLTKGLSVLVTSCVMLTGCASGGSATSSSTGSENTTPSVEQNLDPNTPAWKNDSSENNKLTWYVNAEWFNTDYGNDTITRKLIEDLNLDIEFITGDDTKLNTYFAGGDMPDIITLFDSKASAALKADTWAIPLTELADKYDPYFYKVAKEQTLDWYQLSDGKTYGYPSFSNTQDDYDSGAIFGGDSFIIRSDVYEAIGSPNMSTPEEFLSALGQIKEKFPEIVPFGFRSFGNNGDTGSLGGTLQDLLGVPLTTESGEFYNRDLDEEYLAWLKVLNEAYRKGYISDDNFADDNTIFEEKISNGKYGMMIINGAPQLSSTLQKNIANDSERKYIAIDGPRSEKYGDPTINQAGISGWTITYISKSCKNPSKAIQLFTYLLSEEGQYLTTFGVEGETFEFNEDGKAVLLPEVLKMRNESSDEFKEVYRLGEFWFFGHDRFKAEKGADDPIESIDQIQQWSLGKLKPQFIIENIDPDNGTAEARNLTNIKTTWATTLASCIRAKDEASFDKIIEDYKKFLVDNKFDNIVSIRNEKIKRNIEKLGL